MNGLSTNFGDKKKSGVTDFTVVNGCTVTQPEKKNPLWIRISHYKYRWN